MLILRDVISVRALTAGGVAAAILAPCAASAQASDGGEPVAVEELIVTTQRREERLQDVLVAITACSAQRLEERGLTNTRQLEQVTPGLNFSQSARGMAGNLRSCWRLMKSSLNAAEDLTLEHALEIEGVNMNLSMHLAQAARLKKA